MLETGPAHESCCARAGCHRYHYGTAARYAPCNEPVFSSRMRGQESIAGFQCQPRPWQAVWLRAACLTSLIPITLALASSQCCWQVRRKQGCENATLKSEKHCIAVCQAPLGVRHQDSLLGVRPNTQLVLRPWVGGLGREMPMAQLSLTLSSIRQAGSQLRQMRSVMTACCCATPGSVPVLPH